MPGGDRTGPTGLGPMTGRAAGYCAGSNVPGFLNGYTGRGFGRGMGRGRGWGAGQAVGYAGQGMGRGWGWRNRYWMTGMPGWERSNVAEPEAVMAYPQAAPVSNDPQQEVDLLKKQARSLERSLKQVQDRLKNLENDDNS